MTPNFVRNLIIHVICSVTGEEPDDIVALDEVELDTRDWEQIFSRLEATLDIQTGLLTAPQRTIHIDTLTADLHARLAGDLIA
jgi:hypothetical protein